MKIIKDRKITDIKELVSINTGLPKELLGHNPDIYMNYEKFSNYEINNLEAGVKLYEKYANEKKPIYFYCDYDVDGMGAGAIMDMLSKTLGVKVEIYIPDRFADGYGLTEKYVNSKPDGDALLITFDNGIATHDAIALAKSKGWKVVVYDHHMPMLDEQSNPVLPDADVICDPHVTGGTCEDYCGAGLAYKFVQRCLEDANLSPAKKEALLNKTCVQAAISTIADSVPLKTENYQIVEKGLTLLSLGKCSYGTKMIAEKFDLLDKKISTTDINFGLVPALNAWGRLEGEGAKKVFEALSYQGTYSDEIINLRDTIWEKNEARKTLTKEAVKRADEMVQKLGQENDNIIIVYDKDCMLGLCGLDAGKLTSKYQAPAIVVTDSPNEAGIIKGSGRSYGDVNLKELLDRTANHLYAYGGHPAACGVSLEKDKLNEFIAAANAIAPEKVYDDSIHIDGILKPENATKTIAMLSNYMWGVSNPELIFLIPDITVSDVRVMGKEGQAIKLTQKNPVTGETEIAITDFENAAKYVEMGSPKTIAAIGPLSDNVFKGNHTTQCNVVEFMPNNELSLDDIVDLSDAKDIDQEDQDHDDVDIGA